MFGCLPVTPLLNQCLTHQDSWTDCSRVQFDDVLQRATRGGKLAALDLTACPYPADFWREISFALELLEHFIEVHPTVLANQHFRQSLPRWLEIRTLYEA